MAQIELQKIPTYLKDALSTLLFGFLSAILSKIEFHIPGIVNSDLREIPFLIGLFHMHNPLFVFMLVLSAFYGAPADMPIWAVYVAHLVPLLMGYTAFKLLERSNISSVMMGIAWIPITVVYYLFALLPMVVIAVSITPSLAPDGGKNLWEAYRSSLPQFRYEIITTSLVSGLYLMQMSMRKKLEDTNKNLEDIVTQRTNELTHANNELQAVNEELTTSNEEIKQLNENLERLVEERTNKINSQLNQLHRYAFMNSHELRAPLARILGLLQLLKMEQDPEQIKILLSYLHEASTELDNVIKQMNRLLEKEIL